MQESVLRGGKKGKLDAKARVRLSLAQSKSKKGKEGGKRGGGAREWQKK